MLGLNKIERPELTLIVDNDRTCTVAVHNVPGYKLDNDMLAAVMKRAAEQYIGSVKLVDVYPALRDSKGVLEWLLRVRYYQDNYTMTVGTIQRSPGAEIEFHS